MHRGYATYLDYSSEINKLMINLLHKSELMTSARSGARVNNFKVKQY